MSFHLNQLRFAGLVTSRRDGRSIIYSANFKMMTDLLGYLTENCCGGRPELCAPTASNSCGPSVSENIIIAPKKGRRKSA
jgi:ArsR family transcriptional regulator, arsenate/arsenite/antimonite-responsive transcriptional repressor